MTKRIVRRGFTVLALTQMHAVTAAASTGTTDPNQKTVPGDKGLGVDPNGNI